MIIYILQNDIYGAKYLWKRAPFNIKTEGSQFTIIWAICQCLIQNSSSDAYTIIKSYSWSPGVTILISRLRAHIQNMSIILIQGSYHTITISDIMILLDMDRSQCLEGII